MNANGFVIEILTCKEIICCETDAFLDGILVGIIEEFRCHLEKLKNISTVKQMMLHANICGGI